jgi:hypothetical protein
MGLDDLISWLGAGLNALAIAYAEPIHPEGLLHLAAFTVAVTIGYVGLDKVTGEQIISRDQLEQEITKVSARVDKLLTRHAVIETDGLMNFIFDFPNIYVLCHVAGRRVRHRWPWQRPLRAIHRQRHVPLLNYFRHRRDMRLVFRFAIFATLTFVILTASTVWELPKVSNKLVGEILYIAYVCIIGWIVISVPASAKLRRIGPTCDALEKQVDERLERVLQASLRRVPPAAPVPVVIPDVTKVTPPNTEAGAGQDDSP